MTTTNGKLIVAKIEAENFLLISKMDYAPRPGVNVFVGENRQGKTDVIRLLKAILKGAGAEIISHGKDRSSFMARLSDGHEIRRTITEKSKRFQVKTPEGDFKASPQAFIDALLGDADLSFDPIAFVLKEPKDQKHMLLESFNIGKVTPDLLTDILEEEDLKRLDYNKDGLSVLKDAENIIYAKRTEINKEVTRKKALYEEKARQLPEGYDPGQFKDQSSIIEGKISEKETALSDAKALKHQVENTQSLVDRLNKENVEAEKKSAEIFPIVDLDMAIDQCTKEIAELEGRLVRIKKTLSIAIQSRTDKERLLKQIQDNKDTLDALKFKEVPDITAIEKEIADLYAEQGKNSAEIEIARLHGDGLLLKADYDNQKAQADDLTAKIKKVREELPDQIMKEATIPFESLSFDGDEVVINGNRLSLMATSEQLMTTLQIYKQRNKNAKLKIICADRIECLDDKSYQAFWEFVNTEGYQVFATKVISAHIPEDAVVVEGGELKDGR